MAELNIKGRLSDFYSRHKDPVTMLALYIIFAAVNTVFALFRTYPGIDPAEISVAALSSYFSGNSWQGVMSDVGIYSDFLQGLLYAPIMAIVDEPVARYRAMIILNGLAVSAIPLIIYRIGMRIRVNKTWKLVCAACAGGGYCCYFAHTKFIWTEAFAMIMPWVLIWFIFLAGDQISLYSKHFYSVATAFVCAATAAAGSRLVMISLAAVLTIVFVRVCYGKKIVYLKTFIPSLALFLLLEHVMAYSVQNGLWQKNCFELTDTLENFAVNFAGNISDNGAFSLVEAFIGQLYYLVTASWGMAALALCIFGAIVYSCIRRKRKSIPQSYSMETATFAVYSALSVIFILIYGVFFRAGGEAFGQTQDSVLFGRFLDGVIPFATVLVMFALFTTSINLRKVLGAIAIMLLSFLLFFAVDIPVVISSGSLAISPTLGLYALRIGSSSSSILTLENLTITASVPLCVMVLVMVVINCSKKFRSLLVSVIVLLTTAYSLVFVSAVYLPMCEAEASAKTAAAAEVSQYVYNRSEAPSIAVLGCTRSTAMSLQFLNRNTDVTSVSDESEIKLNSFVLMPKDYETKLGEKEEIFEEIASTDSFVIYAYGEKAYAYALSQKSDEVI